MLFGASMAAQKYGPPLVGTAETISAIPKPTNIATAVGSLHVIRFVASETERTEEANDYPSYRHDTRATRVQTVLEEPIEGHWRTSKRVCAGLRTW